MVTAITALPKAQGTFITFDAPGATCGATPPVLGFCGTFAVSINPAGEILGYTLDSSGASSAFLRSNQGTFTTFSIAGALFANIGQFGPPGSSLNPGRTGTGFYFDPNTIAHGFVSDSSGTITTFDAPGAGTAVGSGQGTYSLAINPAGEVTGYFLDTDFFSHGFFRDSHGTVTEFDPPEASTSCFFGLTTPNGINAAGVITGTYEDSVCNPHGFLRERNGAITVVDIPGFNGTVPQTINNGEDIAGYVFDATGAAHGFVRDSRGSFNTFDLPNARDYASAGNSGMVINPSGATGGGYLDGNLVSHGFRRAADGTLTAIDVPSAGTGALQGTFATSINPAGVITGNYVDANGVAHGFLFLPQ
jgi:hypothetical protein